MGRHGVVTSAPLQYYLSLAVMILIVFRTVAHGADWYETLPYEELGTRKVTRLHFYVHYIVTGGGRNDTNVALVGAPVSIIPFPDGFGLLAISDNPLTKRPKLTSRHLGRVQGIVALVGLEEMVAFQAQSYVFTDKKFNGSTLSVLGRNPYGNRVRELPVVGGTGYFRLARGYAITRTYSYNMTTQNAILKYNITVIHH